MFTVSVPAADRALFTSADVSAALGAAAVTSETDTLILQISDMISRECRIAVDGVTPPTLRRETIVETVRMVRSERALALSRRFVDAVSSITENGVALVGADYEIDKTAGVLRRLDDDGNIIDWPQSIVVCTYTAGFDTVPTDLKLAAIRVIQEQLSASARDPLLRGETVEGIGRFDYWVNGGASASGAISGVVSAMLDPYRSIFA